MRVLWILYLLSGFAACGPLRMDGINSGPSSKLLYDPWYSETYGNSGQSSQGPNFYQGPVAYASYNSYPYLAHYRNSPGQHAAYVAPYPEGYTTGQFWWTDPASTELTSATDQGSRQGNPESFFSDVSNLDPVYTVSGRARYQRGNAVFSQTRYVPGKPALLRPVQDPQPVHEPFPQDLQPAAELYTPVYGYQKWGF